MATIRKVCDWRLRGQAAALSDEDFAAYMEYLRSTVFSETSVPDGLADIIKAVKQRAGLDHKRDGAGRQPASEHSHKLHVPQIGAAHKQTFQCLCSLRSLFIACCSVHSVF